MGSGASESGVLRTRFFHWDLPHPIFIASGPLSDRRRTIEKMIEAGAAGVVTKTIAPSADPRRCRCRRSGDLLLNRDGYSRRTLADWEVDLDALRGQPIIANVVADTPDELAMVCRKVVAAGAEILELGLSCPTLEDEDPICCVPEKLRDFCIAARRAVDVPIVVKLLIATSAGMNREMVRVVREAGADGLSLADTLPSLFLEPSGAHVLGGPGGASGGFLKPLVLKAIYDVQEEAGDRMEFMGIGGVMTAEDAVDYIRAGCSIVQICTLVMNENYHAIAPLVQRLEQLVPPGMTALDIKNTAAPVVAEGH
ncbi:MAG: hypothetical protein AAGF11_13795 [Myxococcota bacterium]